MATVAELEERVSQLEDVLGLTAEPPAHVALQKHRLGKLVAQFAGLLLSREFVSHEAAYLALYSNRPSADQPANQAVAQIVKHLRCGIKSTGARIKTVYGSGWFMEAADKQKLLEAWPELKPKSRRMAA